MRIPAEVVPLASNLGKETSDVRKPEPVSSSAAIGNELSTALPEQAPPAREQQQRRQPRAAPVAVVADAEQQPSGGERRQQERRVQKQAVLLDTRSKRGRRQASGDAKINIKV